MSSLVPNVASAPASPSRNLPAQMLAAGASIVSSTDQGDTWRREDLGINAQGLIDLKDDFNASNGLYGLAASGLFHSADGGRAWRHVDNWTGSHNTLAMAVDPLTATHPIYAASYSMSEGSVLRLSTDQGQTWRSLAPPLAAGETISGLLASHVHPGRIYVVAGSNTIFYSKNYGANWGRWTVGGDTEFLTPLLQEAPNGEIYATTADGASSNPVTPVLPPSFSLWRSPTPRSGWTRIIGGSLSNILVPSPTGGALTIFANAYNSYHIELGGCVFMKSEDGGKKWVSVTLPPTATYLDTSDCGVLTAAPGGRVIASSTSIGIAMSEDLGATWTQIGKSVIPSFTAGEPQVLPFSKGLFVSGPVGGGNPTVFAAPFE